MLGRVDVEPIAPDPVSDAEASATTTLEPEAPAGVTYDQVVGLVFIAVGLLFGLESLRDNSFFTHLATGRLIVADGRVPTADPYSFTAFGDAWTVQSWLASAIYGGLERVAGLGAVRLLMGLSTAALAWLVWRLSRPADQLVARLVIALPALGVGMVRWTERPLLFGLLGLGVVLLAIQEEIDPRWLVPTMWIWVNTHGSFPYAFVAIGCFAVGRWFDRSRPTVELRALLWAGVGTALAVINPLGIRLLVFPARLLERSDSFTIIEEWRAPTWTEVGEQAFALQLAIAVVLLVWRGRSWRSAIPLLVFTALAFQSSRNILQASLVLLPGMAVAAKGLGSIDSHASAPILRRARVLMVAVISLFVVAGLVATPNVDLDAYPTRSLAWMRANDLLDVDDRVVTPETVGNFMEARYGPDEVRTYLDDRVDMYPEQVLRGYLRLVDPDGDYQATLDEVEPTAVLWTASSPFGRWLADPANGWDVVHRDDGWLVATPS